jgi:hydrogenase maturation protease
MVQKRSILVLGLGNVLMRDDGVGVHAANALGSWAEECAGVVVRDGGTLGLSLLPEVETCAGLIVLDAAMLRMNPGSVKTFEGAEMDAQLSGKKYSVHEVALFDLLAAAELLGAKPNRRALIGVQPDIVDWGLEPTSAVAAAIPEIHAAVRALVERWAQ